MGDMASWMTVALLPVLGELVGELAPRPAQWAYRLVRRFSNDPGLRCGQCKMSAIDCMASSRYPITTQPWGNMVNGLGMQSFADIALLYGDPEKVLAEWGMPWGTEIPRWTGAHDSGPSGTCPHLQCWVQKDSTVPWASFGGRACHRDLCSDGEKEKYCGPNKGCFCTVVECEPTRIQ